jgi:hypothetical protein
VPLENIMTTLDLAQARREAKSLRNLNIPAYYADTVDALAAEVERLRAQVAQDMDTIYAAWRAVGADCAGLSWEAFAKHLDHAAPAQQAGRTGACQGTNCGTTTAMHSPECIVETAEAQGWPDAAELRSRVPALTVGDEPLTEQQIQDEVYRIRRAEFAAELVSFREGVRFAERVRRLGTSSQPATRVEPAAYMREGWGPDCGPYVEFYRTDEMSYRDKSQFTPLYAAPSNTTPQAEPVKPCLFGGACKHGGWCSEVYCQERCEFKKTDSLRAIADLMKQADGGWNLPPSATKRIAELLDAMLAGTASKPAAQGVAAFEAWCAERMPGCDAAQRLIAQKAWRAALAQAPAAEPLTDERAVLRHVATLAHEGGLSKLNEHGVMCEIRRLSMPYWDDSGTYDTAVARVNAALTAAKL